MDWQIEAQIREMEHDDAIALATKLAEFVEATVDGDGERFYLALIPRPVSAKAAA